MKRSIKRFKSTGPCVFALCYFYEMLFFIFDLLSSTPFALYTTTLLVPVSDWEETKMGLVQFLGLSLHQQLMKDSKFGLTFWLNLHSLHVNTHVFPSTDLYLPPFSRQMKSTWCWSAPAIPVSEEAAETIWRALNAVSTCRLSCNIQTLFYWGRKGELYTSYHIRLISKYKDLKTKVVSWFSLVIGQNASRQLATSSENLVASAQFLVALATSESQFRAL